MTRKVAAVFLLVAVVALGGCASSRYPAPVLERKPVKTAKAPKARKGEPDWRPKSHVVKKGETLYSIALEYGFGYRELAELNNLDDPNKIQVGQELRLTVPSGGTAAKPAKPGPAPGALPLLVTQPKAVRLPYSEQALASLEKPAEPAKPVVKPVEPAKPAKPADKPPVKVADKTPEKTGPSPAPEAPDDSAADEDVKWVWPAKGKVVARFNDSSNKGIDIAGNTGDPVLASDDGKVVYSGSGLRGYGKLIIIKHNKTYLSAYAHNSRILVKEGQSVAKGQKIGEMGSSDTDRVKLHFEIRRFGKPVDPMKYLAGDKT